MVNALYPGTFDPLTNGHLDIVTRSSRLFDQVIVAVYETAPKNLMFSPQERTELFQHAADDFPNVTVLPFTGLMVEFAQRMGAQVVIRGLRAGRDFENEFEMALMNKKLVPSVEAVYMMTSLEWQFLSSTRVKELAQLGANVADLVPSHVAAALRSRLKNATL